MQLHLTDEWTHQDWGTLSCLGVFLPPSGQKTLNEALSSGIAGIRENKQTKKTYKSDTEQDFFF